MAEQDSNFLTKAPKISSQENAERTNILLLMLIGIVILLMIAIIGLFLRMNQLQREILGALAPLRMVSPSAEGLETGTPAPAFTLSDIKGRQVSLRDFSGQEILLVFSSVQCHACLEFFPVLKEFSERNKDVQLIMISKASEEENKNLVKGQNFQFTVLNWQSKVGLVVAIFAMPSSVSAAAEPPEPETICYCCQARWSWPTQDLGWQDVCYNGQMWYCHVKRYIDVCCGWIRFGESCTAWGIPCTGRGVECLW